MPVSAMPVSTASNTSSMVVPALRCERVLAELRERFLHFRLLDVSADIEEKVELMAISLGRTRFDASDIDARATDVGDRHLQRADAIGQCEHQRCLVVAGGQSFRFTEHPVTRLRFVERGGTQTEFERNFLLDV